MINILKIFLIVLISTILSAISVILTPLNYISKGIGTFFVYKTFAKLLLFISGIKLRINFREKIDKSKTYIIVTNHSSLFDIPILMTALPLNIRFIYKKSLTKIPIFGWSLYLGNYIPINRDNPREALSSLKSAVSILSKGLSIVIFPEGTRSQTGELGVFKKGVFVLSDYAKADLLPVSIIGSNKIMKKKSMKIQPGVVNVVIDKSVEYKNDKNQINDIREIIANNIKNITDNL